MEIENDDEAIGEEKETKQRENIKKRMFVRGSGNKKGD